VSRPSVGDQQKISGHALPDAGECDLDHRIKRIGDHPCVICGQEHQQEVETLRAEITRLKQALEERDIKLSLVDNHMEYVQGLRAAERAQAQEELDKLKIECAWLEGENKELLEKLSRLQRKV